MRSALKSRMMLTGYLSFIVIVTAAISETNGDIAKLEVLAHGMAALPCNVTPIQNDKMTLVIWYKNASSSPIYSVDLRGIGKPEYADHWSDDKVTEGRSYFNFEERSLIIENVKITDEGVYKCRVDYKQTPTRNFETQLIVVEPVENITILEATTAANGTTSFLPKVAENSPLSATCVATGGNPKPKVIWYYEGSVLDDSYEQSSDKEVKNILWLDTVHRRHLDTVLQCTAQNSALFPPISASTTIDLYLAPVEVRLLGENREMSAGRHYDISCQVKGSRPPANVTWWKNSQLLRTAPKYIRNLSRDLIVTTISFVPTESDGESILSCEATNIYIPEKRVRDSWKLAVNYAPSVNISFGRNLNASSIQAGSDVYFECVVRSNPRFHRIRWLHNDAAVNNSPTEGTIIGNQTLVLQAVKRDQAGEYRCAAANTEGEALSAPLQLDIKYEPMCQENQQRVYGAGRNEEIQVRCLVEANPPSKWFQWSFNNSVIHIRPLDTFTVNNGTSIAKYKPITELQYGTLLCSARNELGMQKVPCVYHIVSAGVPDTPHNCSIENKTQNWVHIKCERGFDGGVPQEFICEVKDIRTSRIITNMTSSSAPEFRITGLEPGSSYGVTVYSVNIKGPSKQRKVFEIETLTESAPQPRRVAENQRTFFKSSIVLKIIIITTVVGIILVSIAWAVYKIRRKKRRKRKVADGEEVVKCQISHESISHSDDEKNPDVVPQSTILSYPIISSVDVSSSTIDCDLNPLPAWSTVSSGQTPVCRTPKLLEANKLEELVSWSGTTSSWAATAEPIMLVIPESVPFVQKQNAGTQTSHSPTQQIRKESTV